MAKKNKAVLVPQTELTDAELEQIAGGSLGAMLTLPPSPPPIDTNPPERGLRHVFPGMELQNYPGVLK